MTINEDSKPRINRLDDRIFLDGPAEFLCQKVTDELKKDERWVAIFGEFIDSYQRMDYPIRNLPALRIYEVGYVKLYESWFIDGELTMDILVPASLRREENQRIPDRLCSALLQQFRRNVFFLAMRDVVPGLNELGKEFTVDKTLALKMGEDLVPLTQIKVNFRIDLREWDQHLEDTYRTKDYPFDKVLGDLKCIINKIVGVNDTLDVSKPEVETSIIVETVE